MSASTESERGRWTPAAGDVLERLRYRKETRLRFLHALYEAAEGSTSSGVRFKELGEQLGLTEEETWIVRSYLANEGLLAGATIVYIVITHKGVKEVEEALVAPASSTEHFPPAENVILIGTADGAVIQQGNTDSVQEVELPAATLEEARRQAVDLEARIRESEAQGAELEELVAEAATATAQLRTRRPRLAAVRETVGTVRDLLEAAVSSGKAAAGVLTALGAARGLLALLG